MEAWSTFGTSGYALGALQLFEHADAACAAALLRDCPVVRIAAGGMVDAGQERAQLYIVLRGALEVLHTDPRTGAMERAGERVLPGECVGEVAVLDDVAGPDQVMATQETDLLAIDAPTLWRLVDECNGVARNLLRLLSFRVRAANAQLRRRQKVGEFYRQLSMVDGLTGLQNRAWLTDQLPLLVAQAREAADPLSVIMLDLDHFKRFNDEYGHLHGDEALRVAAQTVVAALRPTDFAARYGGEELLVILPGTSEKAALAVARRLCEQIRHTTVFSDGRKPLPHITASVGLATLAPDQDVDALVAAADAALYRAKQAGRDGVSL